MLQWAALVATLVLMHLFRLQDHNAVLHFLRRVVLGMSQMPHFWMSMSAHHRDWKYRLPFGLSVSFKGTIGRHQYTISCEGVLVRSHQRTEVGSNISISLGGPRSGGVSGSDITIDIDSSANDIIIRVPLTAVTGIYSKTSPDGLELTADPRLLSRPGMQIDQRALYSLLLFGALIPPLTPWSQIARLVPGKVYAISGDDLSIVYRDSAGLSSCKNPPDLIMPVHRQCEELTVELDRTLQQLCPDRRPIILFSGGVDSGLLAARAAAMGWKQTVLVNYQMGLNDAESTHAEAMARWLGLSFERIPYSMDTLEEYLTRLGVMYPLPFADISAFPTFLLAEGVIDRYEGHRVVLDGTGGDGAFGLFGNATWWRRVARLPKFACKLGGFLYRAGKMWMRPNSRIGRLLRILYSSAQMPSVHASIALNPLQDVAYHIPETIRSETHELLNEWLESCIPWTSDLSPHRFSVLDLILVCCGIFAQKDKALFDASPIQVRYPFLEPNMVRLALERAIYWPGAERSKLPLKNLLARHVPREMVFRPKSGLTPPIGQLLQSPAFLTAVDQTLESTGPISSILDQKCVRSMRRRLEQGRSLPLETYRFIWAVVFATRWLDQVGSCSPHLVKR